MDHALSIARIASYIRELKILLYLQYIRLQRNFTLSKFYCYSICTYVYLNEHMYVILSIIIMYVYIKYIQLLYYIKYMYAFMSYIILL